MKVASVREVQHHLRALLGEVQRGREIVITRRGKVVARLVPARQQRHKARWPDVETRLLRLFPDGPAPGKPPSEIIGDLRGERL